MATQITEVPTPPTPGLTETERQRLYDQQMTLMDAIDAWGKAHAMPPMPQKPPPDPAIERRNLLRYYAGCALTGLCARYPDDTVRRPWVARIAHELAAAMLAEDARLMALESKL